MFDKLIANIKNGFRVANATRRLVFSDKELFAYPIIAALISIAIAALVLGLIVAGYLAGTLARLTNAELALIVIVALVVLYFLAFYVTSFFTVAMLLAFREHAKGKRLSMGEALGRTVPYSKLVLEWSAFYTIIITIINIIEGAIRGMLSRYGVVGNVISGMLTGGMNLALAAAVAFSLPVIIDEKKCCGNDQIQHKFHNEEFRGHIRRPPVRRDIPDSNDASGAGDNISRHPAIPCKFGVGSS